MAQIQHRLRRTDKQFDIFAGHVTLQKTNPAVADVAFMKLSAHKWYLTEEMVAFSFFSQHS